MTKSLLNTVVEAYGLSDERLLELLETKDFSDIEWPKMPVEQLAETRYLIEQAIVENRKILVFGDYDCDGLTGSLILYKFLKKVYENVFVMLPTREMGYGLSSSTIRKIVEVHGENLLIFTVDCGVSACAEILWAKGQFKCDVIVTDHHTLPEDSSHKLIKTPVIHPETLGVEEAVGFCGAMVAFWLTKSLEPFFEVNVDDMFEFAAIGTIGDMTPITQKINRQIVKNTFEKLNNGNSSSYGLNLMLDKVLKNNAIIDEETISFQIAPRFNAAGRIKDPIHAFALLATEDAKGAEKMLDRIQAYNEYRKEITDKAGQWAVLNAVELSHCVYIRSDNEEISHGVAGLIASKLVDSFNKTAVVMVKEDASYRCSVRAAGEYNCLDAIRNASTWLIRFGGHKAASGMTMPCNNVSIVMDYMNKHLEKQSMTELYKSKEPIPFPVSRLTMDEVNELNMLKPFGVGFPAPVFKDTVIPSKITKSKDGKHVLGLIGDVSFTAFGMGQSAIFNRKSKIDIEYTVSISYYKQSGPEVSINLINVILSE